MLLGLRSKSLIPLLLALALGCPLFGGKEFLAGPRDRVAADQLLVRLWRGADIRQVLSALAPRAGARLIGTEQNTYLLNLPPGSQAAVSKLLAAHPLVDYVEPNHIRTIAVVPPNDSMYPSQWNLTTINAVQAWSYFPDRYLTSSTAGSNRVKVGILDTGIDCTHPDFMNAGGTSTDSAQGGQLLWASSEAINATTISSPTCPWQDDNGHGTHSAGILAAATGNAVGVASLGFPLQLIVIKTNDQTGQATDSQVATGIYDAIAAGAQVISMSLGGPGYSQTLQTALDYAWANNVLVIAAAGNFGTNELVYPGGGNHVLGVGATDSNNAVAGFSTYGNGVKIAAPGVGVLSTLPTYGNYDGAVNGYGTLSGTSMATPHVAALAGLLFAANPGISAAEVAQRIQQTAQSPNTGWNQYIGYGIINAGAALGNLPGPFTQGGFTGQVTDTLGNPLTGAVVTAGGQTFTTATDTISGDDAGLFRINLNPGTYPVSVAMTGYSTVNMQVVVVAGADTMMTVQLGGSLGEFSGTVTYNSVGVAGAVVEVVSSGTPSTIHGTAVTDSSGNYTVLVAPGSYTLTASAPNYVTTTSASQSLSANGTVTVNLALTALGNIVGTVTDGNGIPVANAHIDFANSSFSGGVVTAANGGYSTYGLPAGTYTVTASASGYTSVSVGSVSVTTSTSTLVNLQFSTGIALNTGLLANWPFNEGSGNTAFDSSGNGYNAALSNTTWTSGFLFPNALSFNGSTSSGTSSAIPFTSAFSVSVWLHPASTSQGSSAPIVQAQSGGWWFGIDQSGAKYKFVVNSGSGSSGDCAYTNVQEGCTQSGPIATGWHMLTGTYDGTIAILYLDGVLVATDTATAPSSASSIVEIGQNWNGALQSLRLYNRALTASEVSTLFSQQTTLTLTKTADAATVSAGNSIGYTLSVTNNGTSAATSAALNDVLPTGTGINWSISPSYTGPGTCSIVSGTLSCSLGTLAAGGSSSVHVTSATTAGSCGAYPNTASASATSLGTAQASATITVTCTQTINFGTLANQVYGTGPFPIDATATSNLGVSFNSQTTPVCTVSGNLVTIVAGGLCTIQATQSGNTYYSAAPPVSQSFTVMPESQSITFNGLSNHVYGAAPFTVSATATSGLTVGFNSSTTLSVCTASGNTVTVVSGGTCTVQATQSGNTNYSAAAPVSQSFTVTPASQTITFNPLSNQSLGAAPFAVSASSSSNLTVSFSSQTTSICTMSGSSVTLLALGTCTIQAAQPGNTNYSAATPVNQSFMVTGGIVITGVNSLNFPNTIVGKTSVAQAFSLQNSGNTPLTIASIVPAGADAANYRYTADTVHPCPISPATLGAGATCMLDVAFAPVSQGSHNSAQIVITDNSGNVSGTTQSIVVTGTGIVLSSIAVSAGSSSLTSGSSGQFTATGTYSDNSTADLTSQVTWASSATGVATISTGGLASAVAAGQTNITATLSTVTSNGFQLTVLPGTAASIAISSGSGQSTMAGAAFGGLLVAAVKDSAGNSVANASVTFTAPSSGASATFSNSATTYTTTTNSSGLATSLALTANSTTGSYSVTAAVTGVATAASFSLTNTKVSNVTVTESVTTLVQGQSSIFTLTVTNASNAGPTSGAVTIMLSVPNGLTLTGLNGGSTWNCNIPSASCTTNAVLSPGSTSSITVTVNVALNAQGPVSIGSGVSGDTTTYLAPILSACAVSKNASVTVTDVQQMVNQALGVSSPVNDLNADGFVNVVDLQIVVNAAMNQGCSAS